MVQEIFGVNSHIRSVADGYAADGYLAIAPAFFDRVERGLDIGYTPPDIERGRAFIPKMQWDKVMLGRGRGARQREVGRQGRHRRLLLGRDRVMDERLAPAGLAGRGDLLRRGHHLEFRREAEVPGDVPLGRDRPRRSRSTA